jgi:hypothetical protein
VRAGALLRDRRLLALLVAETVSTSGSEMTWLAFALPAIAVGSALFAAGLVNGLVNPALHSILTLRAPAAIRPKVMAAMTTMSQIGGPLALLAAGPALGAFGARPVFAVVAAAQTVARIGAGTVGLRLRPKAVPA